MVNNLEGYAEYAVQKKLKAKDRMPVVASAALMVVGLAIWTFIAGWVGPSILIIGIALTIITATRQELEYEYIFVNGDCEISKIVKRSSRKKVYEFEAGKMLSGQEREVVRIHQQQQKPHGSGNCGTE